MKKLILSLLILLAGTMAARAQYAPGHGMSRSSEAAAFNAQYSDLLIYENHLLKNRKTALILSLSGTGVAVVSASVGTVIGASDGYAGDMPTGAAIGVLVGELAALTGGVMYVVNEFKLINCQRKINDHMILRYSPTGVALQF